MRNTRNAMRTLKGAIMVGSRSLRVVVVVAALIMASSAGVWAQSQARPRPIGLMGVIPGDSLFCVRITRLDNTLGAVNEYLEGVAPESFDAQKAVYSKLGGLLGDEQLRGVNKNGGFALFALSVPGEGANQNPMANMFLGALLPMRNYDNFIARNPNCGPPDDEGISTITVDSRPRALAMRVGRFALLCPTNAREKLPQVKKMLGRRKLSLANTLDENERKLASGTPVWAYLNVKQSAPLINPMVAGKLAQIKAELQKAKESGKSPMMAEPAGVVDFYGGFIKIFTQGTDRLTIGLKPGPDACQISYSLKPIPGTEMATLVGREMGGNLNNMLGYLEDGAMMNVASKVDRTGLKTAYMALFDLMGKMVPGGIPETDIEQIKELTTKAVDALGDSLAISVRIDGGSPAPFQAKYVLKVRDKEALEQVVQQELQMMEKGVFNDLYKGFGMQMSVTLEQNAGTYDGIAINAAKVMFKRSGEETVQGAAIAKMFGSSGLEYRWAFLDDYCVYTVGGEPDKTIRELIDQVRAGGPKEVAPGIKAALDSIEGSREADAFGTFSYARMLRMGLELMLPAGEAETAKTEMPAKSEIAFAGRTVDDNGVVQVVVPKAQLQEVKAAFKTLIPRIKKQEELQRQKAEK
jgi:hypothetical protein